MGRLVHDHLLADIEQARARAKPDLILRKLQQELPASVVSCHLKDPSCMVVI